FEGDDGSTTTVGSDAYGRVVVRFRTQTNGDGSRDTSILTPESASLSSDLDPKTLEKIELAGSDIEGHRTAFAQQSFFQLLWRAQTSVDPTRPYERFFDAILANRSTNAVDDLHNAVVRIVWTQTCGGKMKQFLQPACGPGLTNSPPC